MSNGKKFRAVLEREDVTVIPGAYNAHSALLAQQAGFSTVYLGGFSISAGVGYPDWGLATMDEMLSVAVSTIRMVDVPVVCDIDQGFGALTNFVRTIHAYEAAGAAAVHFEDQPFPKKCSQQPNRTLISLEDAVAKIKAAVETRSDPDFVLIARTDARESEGIEGLKKRMDAYLNAGADYCIFCEQISEEELVEVGKAFPGKVFVFAGDMANNPAWCLPVSQYREMGFKAVMYCALGLCSAHHQMANAYRRLHDEGGLSSDFLKANVAPLGEVQQLVKLKRWQALRDKYSML